MDDAQDILHAAELLYAAAASPERWPVALEHIAGLIGGDHAVLHDQAVFRSGNEPGEVPFVASAGVDPRDLARGLMPGVAPLLAPLAKAIPAGVSMRADIIPDREFELSGCYNEIFRPMNGFHALHVHDPGVAGGLLLSICRPRHAENFQSTEAALLRALAPHLSTALSLDRRLRVAEERDGGFARVLDRLADGVILTDASARILFTNARASRIAAEADGLILNGGGLTAATPAATRRLREMIAAASRAAEERRMALHRPSHRPPLLVSVLPIWQLGIALAGAGTPRTAIFIVEPDAPRAIDREAVVEVFQLTPRESEIAVLLAGGADLTAIAAQLGLGLGTVRDHLKNVFEKSGARSQATLVALLRGFTDPLA